jgi:acyl carrier protein
VFEQLKEILVGKFELQAQTVTPAATLSGLELDSLDVVELALVIEKELGVRVSDDELAETDELDAIVRLVAARRQASVG